MGFNTSAVELLSLPHSDLHSGDDDMTGQSLLVVVYSTLLLVLLVASVDAAYSRSMQKSRSRGGDKSGCGSWSHGCRNGYKTFVDKTTGRSHFVHRRVAEKAFGPIPPGYHVHHKDHDKHNNRASNLEILSPSEHAKKHRRDLRG